MNWKRKIGGVALGLGALVIIAVIGGYSYLRSSSFERLAISEIEKQADQATGGRTTVGGLDLSLSRLTANLYDITLRGTESAGQPPLLHAQKLTIQLKVVSLLHRQFSLRELLVESPVVHVEVNHEGKSNFPTPPPSQSNTHTSIFDLAIGHAQLTNGEIDYNDRKIPLDADLFNLGADIRFTPDVKRYDGVLSYDRGMVRYAAYEPLPHSLKIAFSATPAQFDVQSAILRVASSDVSLQASMTDYANPVADGSYAIRIHTGDFAPMSPNAKAQGDILLSGKLHYQTMPDQPVLNNVSVDGRVGSEAVMAVASGKRLELRKIEGAYRLANGNFVLHDFSVDTLGGRILVNGQMNHMDTTPDSRFETSLRDISLSQLQRIAGSRQVSAAEISGRIAGTIQAAWKGAINNLQARSDLTLRAEAISKANPRAQQVPVTGDIHASYDGRQQSIRLHNTVLRVPTANVNAEGTISDHSNLQIQVVADDLHQLELIATSFLTMQNPPPAVSGKAKLTSVIRGSLKKPKIRAELIANDLRVEGSQWNSASLSVQASPSELIVTNGRLINAQQGQATFSANVNLHDWAYRPTDRIQAQLNARQFRIADLEQLANQHYPISGQLNAQLALEGTQLNPSGTGQIEITNAVVYAQPIQKLAVNFHTDNGAIVARLSVNSIPGDVNGDLTFNPKTKAYNVNLNVPGIVLQRLQPLQEKNLQLTGTVTASVKGAGTIGDPQLLATVELPELQMKGKSISQLKAVARIAQHQLDLNMDSKVSQTTVHARGQVLLAGDYQANVNLDTGTIPLDTLVATYAPSVPQGFQGQAEIHASLKGPLKDKNRIEAHLSIPILKASYQSLQIGIAHPIQADYANSVVTLQPADIEGTDTSLHIEGRLPIGGSAGPTLSANGTVDLRIAQIMMPSLKSSGTLDLRVKTAGAAAKPDVKGQVQIKNVAMTTSDAPVGVEQLNGTLDISADRVQISEMQGKMGGGTFSVGGALTYRPSLHFNLAVQAQSVRLLYPTGLRSLLDANLAFSGSTTASTLNGKVLIDSLSFTPDFDLSSFASQFGNSGTISQPGFADTVKLGIAVQSQQTLNATSSQVSINGQVALQVGGTAADPVITGRTNLNSGEVFFRNVRYQLQRGVITFDDPNETRPVLNISVATTIEQYNLTLTMRGPLDKLTTSYVSDPPLATADIINLVARGKTTQESAASTQSTDSMIASQAASELSSSVQKLAGLSSLQIDPTLGGNGQNPSALIAIQQRVTKNLLFTFSTDVSQPGSEMVQGNYQINKKWSVSVERDQLGGVSVDGRYHTRF